METELRWALSVATLNRLETLQQCVRCALSQTRPPSEITIVDTNADWQENAQVIAALVDGAVPLNYLTAPIKSGTVQRNVGIEASSADILFLIDDDSLMHPDCAETIMSIYEMDHEGDILGIASVDAPSPIDGGGIARKEGSAQSGLAKAMTTSRLREFLWRELFLMSRKVNFVAYDGPVGSCVPDWAVKRGLDLAPAIQLPGCHMTARREAMLQEPFEPAFRSYSPGEDFDVSYRLSRRGAICIAQQARTHHAEAQSSRIRREQELVLSICNMAYLLRRHSPALARDRRRWSVLMARRILAEFLKDGLSRRAHFPQLRAAARAARLSRTILSHSDDRTLADTYVRMQERILDWPQ